jgi:cob(I)alamin adenosyltransferase
VVRRDFSCFGTKLATNPRRRGSFAAMTAEDVDRLDGVMAEVERSIAMPREFVLPGATPGAGALDVARAVVRRAERRCLVLYDDGSVTNPHVRRYLNRLSLLLFVLARAEEQRAGTAAPRARA